MRAVTLVFAETYECYLLFLPPTNTSYAQIL